MESETSKIVKMNKNMSKSGLAIVLSQLEAFSEPKMKAEQYITDSETAAFALWQAALLGDIKGRVIADLGCGTGLLGIGALLLGAGRIIFVDFDENALEKAKKNLSKVKSEGYVVGKAEFIFKDIRRLLKEDVAGAELVIQNPPFGTKVRHSDILFLRKALEIAPIVYSFHKSETKGFLERFAAKENAKITHIWGFKFPLKASFPFHRRQIHRINASCFRFEKKK